MHNLPKSESMHPTAITKQYPGWLRFHMDNQACTFWGLGSQRPALSDLHCTVWHAMYIEPDEYTTESIQDLRTRIQGDVANIITNLYSDMFND